jgi:hypothetical protein
VKSLSLCTQPMSQGAPKPLPYIRLQVQRLNSEKSALVDEAEGLKTQQEATRATQAVPVKTAAQKAAQVRGLES